MTGDARDGTDAQRSIDVVRAFVQLRDRANTHRGLAQRPIGFLPLQDKPMGNKSVQAKKAD